MTDKISFSINDAKMINENPNSSFAVMELDFFASGKNLHDMYVSEDTLLRTADTIKNCPLVWKYDEQLDDVYTHDPEEVPCGFVPENAEIKSRKLEDGRTMLSVVAYVWKRYTGELLNFFKRDGFVKPVSVEMIVNDVRELENGLTELLDYKFEGITVLGTFVTPAIPLAKATVLSFSKEYEKLIKQEFSSELYSEVDFTIPDNVKSNIKKAFQKYNSDGKISSVILSTVRHFIDNSYASPEKVKFMLRHLDKKITKNSKEEMNFMLMGGRDAMEWAKELNKKMEEADSKRIRYYAEEGDSLMPYSSLKDINPALKGIEPPISLSQANSIANQADAIGSDKGGWGIAIKHFKDSHKVEDGRWVKKETVQKMAYEGIDFKIPESVKNNAKRGLELRDKFNRGGTSVGLASARYLVSNTNITPEKVRHVAKYFPRHKGDNLNEKDPPSNGYIAWLLWGGDSAWRWAQGIVDRMNKEDEKDFAEYYGEKEEIAMADEEMKKEEDMSAKMEEKMAEVEIEVEDKEEEAKEEEKEEMSAQMETEKDKNFADSLPANFAEMLMSVMEDKSDSMKMSVDEMMKGQFANVGNVLMGMMNQMMAMKDKMNTYMAENEEMKKFKADLEEQQKQFAVEATLKELSEKVIIPDEARQEMVSQAQNYSYTNLDAWKTYCKAKSFDFAVKETKKSDVLKVGMPFTASPASKEILWK